MQFIYHDGGRREAGYKTQRVGDCTVRAAAIALETDYKTVYNELRDVSGKTPRNGVTMEHLRKYLESKGFTWVPVMKMGSGCTMRLNAEEFPQSGTYIARVSKHVVCIRDGVVYDTHNPLRDGTRCVYGYFVKSV